jgi:hypothetical protein
MISIATVGILIIFVYVVSRWLLEFFHAFDHLDHHFRHDDNHIDGHHGVHVISHKEPQIVGGVAGLPVGHDEHVTPPEIERYDTNPKLAVIQGYMSSPSEALWRIGILEADNLLLEVLKEKGYQGEGLGEMLKGASFKTIDLAWDAHKVRNRIAHEGSTFELTEREAKRAYVLYESVFRDLKIMK